jgi:hypothetical protein
MLYANSPDGGKITATPDAEGTCPLCGVNLVSKCGRINAWHWAHKDMANCDPWYEPETPWHFGWKQLVAPAFCEFRLPPHRADILGNGATVIELQHSSISPEEIEEREQFYDNMIWLFDATDEAWNRFQLTHEQSPDVGRFVSFRWLHRRRSVAFCKKPVFLDLGIRLLEVRKLYPKARNAKYLGTPTAITKSTAGDTC